MVTEDTTKTYGRVVVLFATQTGNAEAIANSIYETMNEKGIPAVGCYSAEDYQKVDLDQPCILVIVAATTGDGDVPDDAIKFWRWLRKAEPNSLSKHGHAILGKAIN